MAISHTNLLTQGFHGKVGDQFVLKRHGNSMVLCKLPNKSKKKPSKAIVMHRYRFRAAVNYAKAVLNQPDLRLLYEPRATKYVNIYNLALADFLNKPKVESIDTSGYSGQPGDPINVVAWDDTRVTRVVVSIRDNKGIELEQGECCLPAYSNTWVYSVTGTYKSTKGQKIVVAVYDQPRHVTQAEVAL